jgi:hypothetical protein
MAWNQRDVSGGNFTPIENIMCDNAVSLAVIYQKLHNNAFSVFGCFKALTGQYTNGGCAENCQTLTVLLILNQAFYFRWL